MKDLLVAQLAPPPVRPFSPLPDLEGLRGNAVSVGKYDTGLWEYHFNGNSCIVPKTQFVQRFEDHFSNLAERRLLLRKSRAAFAKI